MSDKLFVPLKVGNMTLAHRLAMAPLTRFRASDAPAHVPLPMVATHYAQRSVVSGTLIISEGVHTFPSAAGYRNAPGIWTPEQISAWRTVADGVHANGSYMFMQLWAMGRVGNPKHLALHGEVPMGPSAIAIDAKHATPKEMSEAAIWKAINGYATAARNAIAAGMDGVEIHGANGYLIDQFLQPAANQRTDAWGGSVEKRARFAVEVTKAVVAAVGAKKVAIRFSPWTRVQGLGMDDPYEQFEYVIREVSRLGLAYLHLIEPRVSGTTSLEVWSGDNSRFIAAWDRSPIFLAGGFTPDLARELVNNQLPDRDVVVVIGRLWTSNPDLPYRIKKNIPLAQYDRHTFYNQKQERGYTDFPNSPEFEREQGSRL